MAGRNVDVVLYGATGYTGKLIAHELDALGASFALAGRSPDKLAQLVGELDTDPTVLVAGLGDDDAVAQVAGAGRVLLSAAGPFVELGPPLLDAAIEAGTHWADITGEQSFLRHTLDQDERAREAGVALVNALGFDVFPSDLACVLACRGLDDVRRLDLGIKISSGTSAGTRRSMAESGGRGAWYDDGTFQPATVGRFVRTFDFPEPIGERTTVFVPWGDVITAPRSTGAALVRTFFAVPERKARTMHLTWPLVDVLGRVGFLRRRARDRLPGPGSGPSPEERARSRFAILAEAVDGDGQVQHGLVTGRDPYGLTGAVAARGAVALAQGAVKEKAGALTPSQALDLERVAEALRERFSLAWRTTGE